MLEELAKTYPKLKDLLITLKEGFQSTIRNIVANEIKEKGIQNSSRIKQERDNLYKIQQQYDERGLIIDEQEDIIESKDTLIKDMKRIITNLKQENQNLQNIIEKHRINGAKLQEENDQLRIEIERVKKIEEDILDRCDVLESTDQELAQALKEMRDQEVLENAHKFK